MGVLKLSQASRAQPDTDVRFASIYREHARFVARSLRRLGVADQHLDDVVQDVFLIVHRRLDQFDARAPMRSWLYGIARGVASNYRRSCARTRERLELVQASAPSIGAPKPVEQLEAAQIVERFLSDLSEANREVFVLSEIEGLSGPEIARALQLNLNTVYARVRKTRHLFDRIAERHRKEAEQR
jgi:RNA polymerase sigma-70 factor (ECF subfamily)